MIDDSLISAREMSRTCRCLAAQRAARQTARRYDAAFRPLAMTSGQFSILAALNQPELVALGILAEILGLDRTTLTRNLAALERQALVASAPGREDRRVRSLTLTPAGRDRLRLAMPLWREAQAHPP